MESKDPTQQGKSHALWKTDSDMDTEVTLAVNSISCEGYEPDTKNASLIGSTTREEIKISEGMIYINLIHSLEKIGDHVFNVTEAIVGN